MEAAQAAIEEGCSLRAPSCSLVAPPTPSVLLLAPSVLPLKRPCSLSRTETAITDPKFGVYIIYYVQPSIRKAERPRSRLARFMGRPRDMTPKARMLVVLGRVWPSQFAGEPPFNRHNWYVRRKLPGGVTREVRCIIDNYSRPPEPTGEPVFCLGVRPAVDGPTAAAERMIRWGGDVWHRASGFEARNETS